MKGIACGAFFPPQPFATLVTFASGVLNGDSCVLDADLKEVVMSAKTKVSALDHATHIAHTWVNDVAKEFDTDDREFAYGVLRAWLHTLRESPYRRSGRALCGPAA